MIDGLALFGRPKKEKKCTGARSSLARKRFILTGMSALSVGLQPLVQALVTELPRDTPLKISLRSPRNRGKIIGIWEVNLAFMESRCIYGPAMFGVANASLDRWY
jgi:hypothetical protein